MIKILILEDEIPARKKVRRFLEEQDTPLEIIAEIDTVAKGIAFLQNNKVDLIFSDIELLDGNSFEIYSQVAISCPIVFTTAYDQFLMNAFESNGIDYLLKPFSKERFQKSWNKFLIFKSLPEDTNGLLSKITKIVEQNLAKKTFKKRLTVHHHQGIYFLDIENISYFEAIEGVIFAHDSTDRKHLLNESTLKQLQEQLNPSEFFRLNRSELVNKPYIEKIEYYTKNSLAVKLKGFPKQLITSQSNTAQFRIWIEQ
jgi:DNA-binding LytR/AlgR family response regulator